MISVQDELKNRVNAFASELSALVRREVLEEIASALGGAGGRAPARQAAAPVASARAERKVAVRKPGRPAKAPVAAAPAAKGGAPASLAQLMTRIHAYIKANPGQGVAPIATSLGVSNKHLRLPNRMLVDERKITSTGKTRGTRYFSK
jgi:hypothetical protein